LYVFYARLGWLPGPGRFNPRVRPPDRITGFFTVDSLLHGDMEAFKDSVRHLILPASVLGWGVVGIVSRLVRASLLDEFSMEYVKVARAMGLRERTVVNTHALRNALLPTITIVAFAFAFLLTGAVLTEQIFTWPGVGSYAVEASRKLDFPAIIGVTILGGVAFLITNLITDVLYAIADPRIRLS
jgi:peptide/nickel transport system permease protein